MQKSGILTKREYQFLMYRYPILKDFILQCWKDHDDDKLLDFLFALETDELRSN